MVWSSYSLHAGVQNIFYDKVPLAFKKRANANFLDLSDLKCSLNKTYGYSILKVSALLPMTQSSTIVQWMVTVQQNLNHS